MPPPQYDLHIPFEGSRNLAYLKEFMWYKPSEFDGKMDPLATEEWMWKIKKILNIMRVAVDKDRIRSTTHQLESEADQWWRDKQDTMDTRRLTWQEFKDFFFLQVLSSDRTRKERRRV